MADGRPMAGLYSMRLTVDGIRHQVQMLVQDHDKTIQASIQEQLDECMKAFDFRAEVATHFADIMKQAIRRGIDDAIRNAAWQPEFKAWVDEQVKVALRKLL